MRVIFGGIESHMDKIVCCWLQILYSQNISFAGSSTKAGFEKKIKMKLIYPAGDFFFNFQIILT